MRVVLTALVAGVVVAGAGSVSAQSKFLQPSELNPALLLPKPPADDSPAAVEGREELRRIASTRSAARLAQAQKDNDQEDVRSIVDVLGPTFDLQRLPATAKLFADLRVEDAAAAKQAKVYFLRERPFHYDAALDKCDDGTDRQNSYPSGHATMGWTAASVLARLMPDKAQTILARAQDYSDSRLYCGVHYRSDLEASHVLATALVERLMQKPAFKAEYDAARTELVGAGLSR